MTVNVQETRVVVEDEDHSESDPENYQKSADSNSSSNESNQEDDNSENEQIDDESTELLNEGWADSIAKILRTNKPKKKKSLVLSKAKKLNEIKKKQVKEESYEVATEDGKVKKEVIVKDNLREKDVLLKRKAKELPKVRVKPNILEKDKERILQKIATKGVVQLFNAVRMQQKDISKKLEEAGPLEVRKEKVLKNIDKRAFLDVLMGEKSTKVDEKVKEISRKEINKRDKTSSEWNVLREDFMMSAKMKDWDKEMEVDSEKEMEVESD